MYVLFVNKLNLIYIYIILYTDSSKIDAVVFIFVNGAWNGLACMLVCDKQCIQSTEAIKVAKVKVLLEVKQRNINCSLKIKETL